MIDAAQLTFHIIYTPGTVRYLLPFVTTLLRWSDCTFRLIANGCAEAEQKQLQDFCHGRRRLEYLALPTPTMYRHGAALNELQRRNQSPYFCFMDSDILACGDFMATFAGSLGRYAGIFSGIPLHCTEDDLMSRAEWSNVWGEQVLNPGGPIPGGSYFAIYDQRLITQLMRNTKVDFSAVRWPNLPSPVRRKLTAIGFEKAAYDTGKVLNLLLQAEDHKVIFQHSAQLQHIGGISLWATPAIRRGWLPPSPAPLLTRLQRRIKRLLGLPVVSQNPFPKMPPTHLTGEMRKRAVSGYFGELLHALVEQHPLPPRLQVQEPEVNKQIAEVTRSIVELWEQHADLSDENAYSFTRAHG